MLRWWQVPGRDGSMTPLRGGWLAQLSAIPILGLLASVTLAGAVRGANDAGVSASLLDGLPLLFEAAPAAKGGGPEYVGRSRSGIFLLNASRVTLCLDTVQDARPSERSQAAERIRNRRVESKILEFEFIGANPAAWMSGLERSAARVNYLFGSEPSGWRTEVPVFERVRVHSIYPGIDLVYYGNQQRLEYDFVVAPGANPAVISFRVAGADELRIDRTGELVIRAGTTQMRQHRPLLHQEAGGLRREIAGGYKLKADRTVAFEVGPYDPGLPLVIDPVLSYSTYFGRGGTDIAWDIGLDGAGNIYLAGETLSGHLFTTPGAFQPVYGGGYPNAGGDAFVAKFDNTGSHLLYLTYLGGNGDDAALALRVDSAGNAFLTGVTDSTNFPVRTAFQPTIAGPASLMLGVHEFDAFVTKLNPTGSGLVFSTYLGGDGQDQGIGIALDAQANVYVAGNTYSSNFPTVHALQRTLAGLDDAFVAKFSADGSRLLYSTYLGGASYDAAEGIAVDSAGRAFIAGLTRSTDFPTANAIQPWVAGGRDAFVAGLGPAGTNLVLSTYLGGTADDAAYRLAISSAGEVYVVGTESSGSIYTSDNFPVTPGPLFPGGVYQSADAGSTWAPFTAGLLHPELLSLAADPAAANVLYAGTSHGVARSADGGATWDPRISAVRTYDGAAPQVGVGHVFALAADSLRSGIVYAGTADGVYKSTNYGTNWVLYSSNLHYVVLSLAVDPQQSSNVYAGTSGGGVFRSSNGGISWAAGSGFGSSGAPSHVNQIAIDPGTPSSLYAATDGGIFKSVNRGSSWFVSSGGMTNFPVYGVVLEPQNPQTLYAQADGELYKSTTGGTNWLPLSLGPTYTNVRVTGLTVDPSNPGTVYAGAHHTVLKSTDGGAAWSASTNGLARGYNNYVRVLLVSPLEPNVVYAGFSEAGYSVATDQGFLTVLDTTSGSIRFSIPFGFNGSTEGWAVALDAADNPYVVGTSSATTFTTYGAGGGLSSTNRGGYDAFVTALRRDGSSYLYSVLLGGTYADFGYGIALDPAANAYIAGETFSTNFPTVSAFQGTLGGLSDAFLAKLAQAPALAATLTGNRLQLQWPAFAPEYRLQESVGSGPWNSVPQPVLLTNGWHTVNLPASEATALFRLRRP